MKMELRKSKALATNKHTKSIKQTVNVAILGILVQ